MTREMPPAHWFEREDESDDAAFYREPRFVTHIDDSTIAALTAYYDEVIPGGARVLDLMSSWISHLPPALALDRVIAVGMNQAELDANQRADERHVIDLNRRSTLPLGDSSVDAVLIAVSVQYLVQPVPVFEEITRVLAPGGQCIVALSHRLFPTKAVLAFRSLPPEERCRLVGRFMDAAGLGAVARLDRSPPRGDPLWIVRGEKIAP